MVFSTMRFSLAGPDIDDERRAEMHSTMIEMSEFADQHGVNAVVVSEHHGTENGWMPSPMVLAGMIAARTKELRISISALLVPLHDPLRAAEDLLTLDIASRGRVVTIAGLGYRKVEYDAHLKDWDGRGALMDETIDFMLKAWTAEPFDYKGNQVVVTPAPYTKPHPPFIIGGESKPAARRAARFNLPFSPAAHLPELEAYYAVECAKHGNEPMCLMPPGDFSMVFLSEDPESAWAELGPYFLADAAPYASWQSGTVRSAVYTEAKTVAALREEGKYEILTPDECVERINAGQWSISFHPLCGGMPTERGWETLHLFAERVLPKVP